MAFRVFFKNATTLLTNLRRVYDRNWTPLGKHEKSVPLKFCKNPWNTVISALNGEKTHFEKTVNAVGRVIENMDKLNGVNNKEK